MLAALPVRQAAAQPRHGIDQCFEYEACSSSQYPHNPAPELRGTETAGRPHAVLRYRRCAAISAAGELSAASTWPRGGLVFAARARTWRCLLAACRGALLPAEQPTWCFPGRKSLPHLGQNLSSVPWPRSFPDPRTSGGARKCTLSRQSSAKLRLQPEEQGVQGNRLSRPPGWSEQAVARTRLGEGWRQPPVAALSLAAPSDTPPECGQ